MHRQNLLLGVGLCLLLSACGGGSEATGPEADPLLAGTDVPTSATRSAGGAVRFAISAFPEGVETREPLELGDVQLAVSDTDEPSE